MNSQIALSADLGSPLPERQFRGFLIFFHIVFLGALGLTYLGHLRRGPSMAPHDYVLGGVIALLMLTYLFAFAVPSLVANKDLLRRSREAMELMAGDPGKVRWVDLRWWALYISVSVGLVLAAARIDRAFEWAIIAYIGQISALPMRFSVPGTVGIMALWLLNRFGWTTLESWGFFSWTNILMQTVPIVALVFFLGRMVVTSAERGRLLIELALAKQKLELARDREVELATLQERERLARDLHDNLGHSLVTLTVQLEAAQRLLHSDIARAESVLFQMQNLTRSSMEDLRRSLAGLRAPGLGDKQLSSAIQDLCTTYSDRNGLKTTCRVEGEVASLPPTVAEALWRMVQEGLTNVEKHARAHSVNLELRVGSADVTLRITDDGIGLKGAVEDMPGHYGLRGLRERVEGLGGAFTVLPNEFSGATLEARIPLIKQ
jgi:signal transduction histidine kinase